MKIGLLGFVVEDANKGCEALTYSFLDLIRKNTSEKVQIHFFVSQAPLEKLHREFPEFVFSAEKIKLKDPKLSFISTIKSCDCVCDITCGDGFSDIYFPKNVFFTTLFKAIVEICGRPLFLLPQTYGPFKNKKLEKFAKIVLKHSKGIYSRDRKSSDYVKKLTKMDVMTTTDLAFALPYNDRYAIKFDSINIGINISGLLWSGGFTDKNQFSLTVNYRDYIYSIISELKKREQVRIHLIPHVIENEKDHIDGDYRVCKKIAEEYNLICAPAFETPVEAKSYISKMDFFIGARMHSTIAAYSAKVPVIPFSYSRKFEGLYENLGYPYLIHGTVDSTETAINNTLDWLGQREMIQRTIDKSMCVVNDYLDLFEKELRQRILIDHRRRKHGA